MYKQLKSIFIAALVGLLVFLFCACSAHTAEPTGEVTDKSSSNESTLPADDDLEDEPIETSEEAREIENMRADDRFGTVVDENEELTANAGDQPIRIEEISFPPAPPDSSFTSTSSSPYLRPSPQPKREGNPPALTPLTGKREGGC